MKRGEKEGGGRERAQFPGLLWGSLCAVSNDLKLVQGESRDIRYRRRHGRTVAARLVSILQGQEGCTHGLGSQGSREREAS
jgi:hypothetical protein